MKKKIKIPLTSGFANLCSHIRAIKKTAELSGSAVAELAEATAESVKEIEGILNDKADKSGAVSVTIPTTGWATDSSSVYTKYYDIAVSDVTTKDVVHVSVIPASLDTAVACGMCPACETLAGKIRIRAVSTPTTSMTANYWIEKGV